MKIAELDSPLSMPYRGLLAGLVVLGLLQATSLVALAALLQAVVAGMSDAGSAAALHWQQLLLLGVLAVLGPLARLAERVGAERLGNRYIHNLRLRLFDAVTLGGYGRADRSRGIHLVRFASDLTAIRQWISLGLARLIGTSLFLSGVVVAILVVDGRLALLVGAMLALFVLATVLLGFGFETSVRRTRKQRGRIANAVAEVLANGDTLVEFGRTARERRRVERLSADLGHAMERRGTWIGMLRGFTDLAHRLIMILVLITGSALLSSGDISLESVLVAVGVTAMLGGPLRDLGRVFEYWKSANVAAAKLGEVLDRRPLSMLRPARLEKGPGGLSIEDVRIDGLFETGSLLVRAGERVAITGANGSGKTTLLQVLAGLCDTDSGKVRLDGIDTRRLRTPDRRRSIGMASNRGSLVSGSISKNIRYRWPGGTDAAMAAACEAAGLMPLIDTLDRGLSTRLGHMGEGLSAGESSRVKLARAILGEPRLLLLDEIESALDPAGRRAFEVLLDDYPGTIIYSTHDSQLQAAADQVWSIADGRVGSSRGSHQAQRIVSL